MLQFIIICTINYRCYLLTNDTITMMLRMYTPTIKPNPTMDALSDSASQDNFDRKYKSMMQNMEFNIIDAMDMAFMLNLFVLLVWWRY